MKYLKDLNNACMKIKENLFAKLVTDDMDEEDRYELWDRFEFNIMFEATDFKQNNECYWSVRFIDSNRTDDKKVQRVYDEDDCLSDFVRGPFSRYVYVDLMNCMVSFDRVGDDIRPIIERELKRYDTNKIIGLGQYK